MLPIFYVDMEYKGVIRDEWQMWFYMVLAVAVTLWILALFGCANDPPAPIQAYREAYGFTPR